jgi:drug/metabolite transporter (DMT)-like permease
MPHDRDGRFMARVLLAFGLLYVIWGSTYLAIRVVITGIPPATSAGLRFTIAGTLMLLVMRLSGQHLGAPVRELAGLAVVGFLLLVCANGLVVWSEQYVPSGRAALMVATVSLWIAMLGAVLPGGERLAPSGWLGVLLGLVGLCTLLWPKLTAGLTADLRGEAALLLASLCWASGSLYAKRLTATLSPFVATGWEMLFAGLVLSMIAAAAGEFPRFAPTRASWLALAYLIVFGSCIAFTAYIWLLRHVAAAKVTTYAYVNPVIAVLLGCTLLDEPFTRSTALGAPIIIAAVALVITARIRTEERAVSEPRTPRTRTAA